MRGQIVETASIEIFGPNARTTLIEPPLQVESHLFQTVQCADWLCGMLGRLSYFECDPIAKPESEIAQRYFGVRLKLSRESLYKALGLKLHFDAA